MRFTPSSFRPVSTKISYSTSKSLRAASIAASYQKRPEVEVRIQHGSLKGVRVGRSLRSPELDLILPLQRDAVLQGEEARLRLRRERALVDHLAQVALHRRGQEGAGMGIEAGDGHLVFPIVSILAELLNRSAAALHGAGALGLCGRPGVVDVDLNVGVAIG